MRRSRAESVFVVGHDMGTSVATELMAHNGGQRTAHRTINYIELPDTAHCPQIEQPELISAALGKALAGATWP